MEDWVAGGEDRFALHCRPYFRLCVAITLLKIKFIHALEIGMHSVFVSDITELSQEFWVLACVYQAQEMTDSSGGFI